MKPTLVLSLVTLSAAAALGAPAPTALPPLTVYSPFVANQSPVATFAMPVSALRFEPRVDLQGRNLVEGQADVTIRGGIFENTGFRIGAVSILDPQTGHYLADIPVAPAMLGAPEILTGAELAGATTNATVGAVAYEWRPIATRGAAQVGWGDYDLRRGEFYQGAAGAGPTHLGMDVAVAHSASEGAVAFGDHHFDRFNARLQFVTPNAQTDLFAGYQAKFFGWPNLYTPFNSDETENLQTLLLALNHRVDLGGGDYLEAGVYHRRNKDDYAYDRFAPLGPVHPFQHTSWEDGAALELRRSAGGVTWHARGEVLSDFLKSTALTFGRYHSRVLSKLALIPEKSWAAAAGGEYTTKLGVTYDASNRDGGALSPVAELSREFDASALRRVYASYAQTTQEPTYTALDSSPASGLFRGNPDLGRETSQNLEVGAAGMAAGWTATGAVFARRDRSLVDWTFQRGVFARSANAVNVDTAGAEIVLRRSWRPLEVVIGYTVLTKNPDYRGAAVDASFYALNYARQRLTAAATLRLGHGFEVRMDNVARIQAPNLLRTTGGDRGVYSTIALAYRPAWGRGVELSAEVDNLWNSRFEQIPAVPATPREWSVGASYVW